MVSLAEHFYTTKNLFILIILLVTKIYAFNRNPPNLLAHKDVSVGDDHDGDEDVD